ARAHPERRIPITVPSTRPRWTAGACCSGYANARKRPSAARTRAPSTPELARLTSLLLIALVSPAPAGAATADLTQRALPAYRGGRCAEASPLLERALTGQPRNATLRKLLADCRMRERPPAVPR